MSKRKQLSIEELRAKQQEITRQLEQLEQAERATIGQEVQRITGLASLGEINAMWQLVPRNSASGKLAGKNNEDELFRVKDPFHREG